MSTKSNKSTNSGLRNSFALLNNLEDSQDLVTPKKKQQPQQQAAQPQSPLKNVVNKVAKTASAKKDKTSAAAKKDTNSKKTVQTQKFKNESSSCNAASAITKMLVFAVLLLVMPLGAYYWAVNQAGLNLGEMKSALLAVLVVNVLLFAYVVMAYYEDAKAEGKDKAE